ncbi:MAG: AsmA family protein [Pseudomonadota bacterium]
MRTTIRTLIVVIALVALGIGVVMLVLSTGLSTDGARAAIEQRISAIIGLPVRLSGRTEVHFFPAPYATFNDISIVDRDGGVLMQIDRVEGDFDLLSIMRSAPTFLSFRMEKPSIFLKRGSDGLISWPPLERDANRGSATKTPTRITDSIVLVDAIRQSLPPTLGRAQFNNGTINFIGEDGAATRFVSQLTGTIDWPSRDGAISIDARFSWEARPGTLDLDVGSVGALFSSQGNAITAALSLGEASIIFDGEAALAGPRFSTGDLELSFANNLAVRRWIDGAPRMTESIDRLGLSGSVSFTEQRARMDDAEVILNEDSGQGALELMTRETGSRVLTATLAFDALDVGELVRPLWRGLNLPFEPAGGVRQDMTGLNVDVRISASSASLGNVTLTDMAGAVSLRDDLVSIDIGDATVAGGNLQVRFKDDGALSDEQVSFSAKGVGIDTTQLFEAVALGPLLPQGVVNFTTDLHAPSGVLRNTLAQAYGSLTLTSRNARLSGISIGDVLASNDASQFFALPSDGQEGDLFDSFDAQLTLTNGALRPEELQVVYPEATLSVNGIISALNGSLALTASFDRLQDNALPPPPVFIGGTLSRPFATFVLSPPDQIQ